MSELNHQIQLALRTAAGHARAANDTQAQADKTYEMKMKSAGAAVYEAWALAVRSQPEYLGRKIDDKALVRIYESTKPRPWWDKQLAAIKVEGKPADREWAKRTLQWHLDPDAARARRAHGALRTAVHHKRVKEQADRTARGVRTPQADAYAWPTPSTAELKKVAEEKWGVRTVGKAVELGMGYGTPTTDIQAAIDEIDRLLERAKLAVRRSRNADHTKLAEATAHVRALVEELEAM